MGDVIAAASPVATKNDRDVYFVSPVVDMLVAGGGLSMIFFVVLSVAGLGPYSVDAGVRPDWAWKVAGVLAFVVNYPHFAATNFRLYQSFDRMMQFPKTSFLSPVVVIAGLAWALVDMRFAPWYAKIFITWSGYHFCAQTKGIVLLYARRIGIPIDGLARWLIVVATHTPWLYNVVNSETFDDLGPHYSVIIPKGLPFGIALPAVLNDGTRVVALAIFFGGLVAAVVLVARTLQKGRTFPLAAILPLLAQALWFGPVGGRTAAFNEFVPFFHSLQYLIIAWIFQLKEESAREGFTVGLPTVGWETAKWLLLIVAGGTLLFEIWPRIVHFQGYAVDHAFGCVIAAVQIHHFFVDGVIWKIRDPRTRAMLAGNVLDLAGLARA